MSGQYSSLSAQGYIKTYVAKILVPKYEPQASRADYLGKKYVTILIHMDSHAKFFNPMF